MPANDKCFYIDAFGVVFSEAPVFSGSVLFTYRGGELATTTPASTVSGEGVLGRRIMSEDEFVAVGQFLAQLSEVGFDAVEIEISANSYEVLVDEDVKILVDKEHLDERIENIKAALRAERLKTDRSFLKTILYIDLRFDNRIYYKYR
jgi:hypothetical protein